MKILLFTLLSGLAYGQSITDSLIVHYSLDTSGTDLSSNQFQGVLVGGMSIDDRAGNPGKATYFDGIDDHFILPNIPEMKPDLPITISLWVRPDLLQQTNNQWVYTGFEYNTNSGIGMNTSADGLGHIVINIGDRNGSGSSSRHTFKTDQTITTGVWQHIVAVIHGPYNIEVYLDCNKCTGAYSGNGSGTIVYGQNPGNLSRAPANAFYNESYFIGGMDDFMMWNRALTTLEVTEVCQMTAGLEDVSTIEPDPLSWELFPVPSDKILNIRILGENQSTYDVQLLDMTGRVVKQLGSMAPGELQADVSDLNAGTYMVQLRSEDTENAHSKLIAISHQ